MRLHSAQLFPLPNPVQSLPCQEHSLRSLYTLVSISDSASSGTQPWRPSLFTVLLCSRDSCSWDQMPPLSSLQALRWQQLPDAANLWVVPPPPPKKNHTQAVLFCSSKTFVTNSPLFIFSRELLSLLHFPIRPQWRPTLYLSHVHPLLSTLTIFVQDLPLGFCSKLPTGSFIHPFNKQ